jgi:hypothetical protein
MSIMNIDKQTAALTLSKAGFQVVLGMADVAQ